VARSLDSLGRASASYVCVQGFQLAAHAIGKGWAACGKRSSL
jgi:hypothetical protein